jgi:RNA-directed DNA polymerase
MGLFDWLKSKVTGQPATPPAAAPQKFERLFADSSGICPYCSADLRTSSAQQCFNCGCDWHNPNQIVRRGPNAEVPLLSLAQQVAQQRRANGTKAVEEHLLDLLDPTRRVNTPQPFKSREPETLSNLDLGPLTPLSSEQVREQANNLNWRNGNPWFGRQDLIPPLSDPRTKLIDQGMLGQGFITSEELTEIHRVGALMDELRPQLNQAAVIAQQAVQADQQQRAEIKAAKKAAAAEKKRLRQVAIQTRHEQDIIYLGRGVSAGLSDRLTNQQRLQELGLPVISSPLELAMAMDLSIKRLRWLCFHSPAATRVHYRTFTIPKKSGGVRQLSSPLSKLRKAQQWVLENILNKLPVHAAAHGFVKERSIRTNAEQHPQPLILLNLDLQDFFPSISFKRVKGTFASFGYSPCIATILALLCTEAPRREVVFQGTRYHVATGPRGLPQGACTSPALSNLISRKLDRRLHGLAVKLGWNYTRYADDISFSTNSETASRLKYLWTRVKHFITEEGFVINPKKTRVQRRHTQQSVTGVVVNQRPGAPRELVRRLRAILHQAQRTGLAAQNRHGHPDFNAHLQGQISYVKMLNPQQAQKLEVAWQALQPN